jgi:hypothetical protein
VRRRLVPRRLSRLQRLGRAAVPRVAAFATLPHTPIAIAVRLGLNVDPRPMPSLPKRG